ncbi:unnamed protein product [Prunus armeniaca]
MEYDGELDEEAEAFGAELESLLQGDIGINMVFILPKTFKAAEGQENTLEGDVFSQKSLLLHRLLIKMGRTEKDLIPTRLIVTNFAEGITMTHGILDVDVIVGTKELKIAFFVVDTTSITYNALLGRDWIH